MEQATAEKLLMSIAANQLMVLCGAGLSMAAPSKLPSAAGVARSCWAKYSEILGEDLDAALRDDIEGIARHFFALGHFESLFLSKLVPWEDLKSAPNSGHDAIADFLACKVVSGVVSANFDTLCEDASNRLGERDFRAIVDTVDLAATPAHGPLLKVHGCAQRSRQTTIWCKEQLAGTSVKDRMDRFANWLKNHILGKDLLVVGFWSDWGYFGDLLAQNLTGIGPKTVYAVNPDSAAQLELKAPKLWEWAHGPGVEFVHIRQSGDTALDELRKLWSSRFVKRMLNESAAEYTTFFDAPAAPSPDLRTRLTSQQLYALRRDLTGVPATAPVRDRDPAACDLVAAAIHRRLIDKGAEIDAHQYRYGGQTLRVVSGQGRSLSRMQKEFSAEPPILSAVDRLVCAGAVAHPVPGHIVRGSTAGSIVRPGTSAAWSTHEDLVLSLQDPP
ncbi:MAG TPA: SIR2 family protein [Phycisphaerales bacterium]|nr:SIR2 family protein [Phycisphaerales bacterium]